MVEKKALLTSRMSAWLPVPPQLIMHAFMDPEMRPRNLPNIPFNMRPLTLERSIQLTLAFLGACTPAFKGGELWTYEDGTQTVLWFIYRDDSRRSRVISEPSDPQDESSPLKYDLQNQVTGTEYYFDAHGWLVVRDYQKFGANEPVRSDPRRVGPKEPLGGIGRARAIERLQRQREEIALTHAGVPHLSLIHR